MLLSGSLVFELPLNNLPDGAMYSVKYPDEMTPDERAREVAVILAGGYLRLTRKSPYRGDNILNDNGKNAVTSDITNSCVMNKSVS